MEVKKILDVSWHRNGIGGVGFYAVLFTNKSGELMTGSVFDEEGYCAVYAVSELAKNNIAFANGNSWRGDVYEAELRPLIKKFLAKQGTNRIGPFSIPD